MVEANSNSATTNEGSPEDEATAVARLKVEKEDLKKEIQYL